MLQLKLQVTVIGFSQSLSQNTFNLDKFQKLQQFALEHHANALHYRHLDSYCMLNIRNN